MKPKITLKDIAKELDVSISTVSKALKDSPEISKETKDKVQSFAKFYKYRPNNIALSLKNKRTRIIGVIIPDIVHHFFTTVFRGIEEYANSKGYNVIICVSNESFEKEVSNMQMLANGSIDGFIMSLSAETQFKNDFNHLVNVADMGIPLVLFDRVTDDIECDKVIINDAEIAEEAVQSLINGGKLKIGLITTEGYFNVSKSREEGYKNALRTNNLGIDTNLILTLPYNAPNELLITEYFKSNKMDAVLCVNEIFAIQAMSIVQNMGYVVPNDISIIGYTDGLLSKFSKPSLTSIAQHGDIMGKKAAELLIGRIESESEQSEEIFRTEIIKATIIKRESTINL